METNEVGNKYRILAAKTGKEKKGKYFKYIPGGDIRVLRLKKFRIAEPMNALAELSERIRNGLYINQNDKRFDGPVIVSTLDANDVLAAQRIVAELAKVNTIGDVLKIMAKCN